MSKKLYTLISAIVGAVATIATAVLAYVQPAHCVAWVSSVGIIATAANEVLLQFVTEEPVAKQ